MRKVLFLTIVFSVAAGMLYSSQVFAINYSWQPRHCRISLSMGDTQAVYVSDHDASSPIINDFMCPDGYAITTIAYKDAGSLNLRFPDGTNAVTARCSKINENGTVGQCTDYFQDEKLKCNPNPLRSFSCPQGSVAIGTYDKDFPGPLYSDLWDGMVPRCAKIMPGGIGETLGYATPNTDINTNPRALTGVTCPAGTVLVGFNYDNFGRMLPEASNIMDSIGKLYCRRVVATSKCW